MLPTDGERRWTNLQPFCQRKSQRRHPLRRRECEQDAALVLCSSRAHSSLHAEVLFERETVLRDVLACLWKRAPSRSDRGIVTCSRIRTRSFHSVSRRGPKGHCARRLYGTRAPSPNNNRGASRDWRSNIFRSETNMPHPMFHSLFSYCVCLSSLYLSCPL